MSLGPGAASAAAGLTPNRPPVSDISAALREAPEFLAKLDLRRATTEELERRILGMGHYAYAFSLDSGLVLKVTDDEDDARVSRFIQLAQEEEGPIEGLPYIVDVVSLPGVYEANETEPADPRYLYAIVMERVRPARDIISKERRQEIRVALRLFADGIRDDETNLTPDEIWFIEPIKHALAWLRKHHIVVTDTHVGNIGTAAGGRRVIFDFGHGSVTSQSPRVRVEMTRNGSAKLARAKRVFDECFDVVEQTFPDFGDCELHHDERAGGDNGAGSDRQYGYCKDGDPIVIAFASKIEDLPVENIRGLMRHEFGHAIDFRYGKQLGRRLGIRLPIGVERRADAIAAAVFGDDIRYDERLVQCVRCQGVSPRPRRLPA